MVKVTFEISDKVASALGGSPETVARHILENAAIEGYRAGGLSQRQVGEMLGFDYWQAERFLADHKVPMNYSAEELEADEVALAKVLNAR